MTKAEIIEYLYDNNVRADITIEQMAEDLADRKTENSSEIPNNCKDEPQTVLEAILERQTDEDRRKMEESIRKAIKGEPQTERSE